ncbi:MAG: arsenate reductase family protein [Defluviitaleaceae bacterium]|nr:arsenate reductase family protein [Defluviitaleaceae bacterium]
MLLLYYPKCGTCQNAQKWLDDNGFLYTARNIKEENPTYEELKEWHVRSNLPLKKFFNTSGLVYRSMDLKDKVPHMTEEESLRLLSTDGMLVKRPLLVGEDMVLVGFKLANWKAAMLT